MKGSHILTYAQGSGCGYTSLDPARGGGKAITGESYVRLLSGGVDPLVRIAWSVLGHKLSYIYFS